MEHLFGKTLSQLQRVTTEAGLPAYTARQLADWLYAKNVESFDAMLNVPKSARQWLAEHCEVGVRPPLQFAESKDGTRKYLFPSGDSGFVEAAFIPEENRATLCLSVQTGCKMGCLFCMTGKQGFQGNLTAGEILNQYRSLPERDRLTNIVYMGMGEPMDNLDGVLESLEVLTSDYGYRLSPTRITVSTVGLVPAMVRFLTESRCHLAVSLHSPFDEERASLMPVERVYPLKEVLAAVREHTRRGQRRVSFEYIMFASVNDTPRHAAELVRIVNGIRCRVNLIPYHPIPGTPLEPSSRESMESFQKRLAEKSVRATIRQSRGVDIAAACGLLSTRELVRRKAP